MTKQFHRLCLLLLFCLLLPESVMCGQEGNIQEEQISADSSGVRIRVSYLAAGKDLADAADIPLEETSVSGMNRISVYRSGSFRVEIQEINRGSFAEITGLVKHLSDEPSCGTFIITFPCRGTDWKWFHGLDKQQVLERGERIYDVHRVETVMPPDGAFNGSSLPEGGYGDPVGRGAMSYYPLCAVTIGSQGKALAVDMELPVVYRLGAVEGTGLVAEMDIATSPLTTKFPNSAFFRLYSFSFDPEWGMRAALKSYYAIQPEAFKKRVVSEGIWLPFTPLRSIPDWQDFGFAFHETSWGSKDTKDGQKIPNILSDRGTGVRSFQYTEPWDLQLPVRIKTMDYDEIVYGGLISREHRFYLDISTTWDKNGRWQIRRLETPWFRSGWAVSITTNCDPDLPGFNKYQYVLNDEINPSLKMDVDGIYFDSMEWNWHHDLNYREDHFAFSDYPLTFSMNVGRPAIWNFASEFKFMKKISDEMHLQGKLAMGNGHGWNPFAAANLDLFGAELSWYSTGDHNTESLDFKRAISFQKPIVFLLNEGLNDKAFTEPPYNGYEIYFEKMLSYGFFPSFFSVDASSDPYWQDMNKIENGRPFFRKYIPVIKKIASAGWEPVTYAHTESPEIRIERFGDTGEFFFTLRNNGEKYESVTLNLDLKRLGIPGRFEASELVDEMPVKTKGNRIFLDIPAGRTKVIQVLPVL
jgi:hypothetical protein